MPGFIFLGQGIMKSKRSIQAVRILLVLTLVSVFPSQLSAQFSQPRSSQLVARAEQVTGDRFRINTSTPMGVTVFAVTAPRTDTLAAIDRGFAELFAVARRHGYQNHLSFRD